MTRDVHWSEVVDAASAALAALAPALPPPAGAIAAAAAGIARGLAAIGCAILECPGDVATTLQPADLPTGNAGASLLHRLRMRGAGFDQDADEIQRSARAEKLAEGVVVIRRRSA